MSPYLAISLMYDNYRKIFQKIDVVHVPKGPGGMENWGLITISEGNTMETNPHNLACTYGHIVTLIHEGVHTWFGNFVTCSSFNHLFINEGNTSSILSYTYMCWYKK